MDYSFKIIYEDGTIKTVYPKGVWDIVDGEYIPMFQCEITGLYQRVDTYE